MVFEHFKFLFVFSLEAEALGETQQEHLGDGGEGMQDGERRNSARAGQLADGEHQWIRSGTHWTDRTYLSDEAVASTDISCLPTLFLHECEGGGDGKTSRRGHRKKIFNKIDKKVPSASEKRLPFGRHI